MEGEATVTVTPGSGRPSDVTEPVSVPVVAWAKSPMGTARRIKHNALRAMSLMHTSAEIVVNPWRTAIAPYSMSVRKEAAEKYDRNDLTGVDRRDSGFHDRQTVGLHHRSRDAGALGGHRFREQLAVPCDDANPQIVSPVAARLQRCGHASSNRRRKKIRALPHRLSDRRCDEEDERDHARHRISGQPV